jgi:hypothetical protein
MAAGMVIAGSVLVVVTVGEQLAGINSLETRRLVEEFLSSTPGSGLDVPQARLALRTALMVVAGCATAAAVLGYHVLQRSRPARLGLSLLALPLFFGGLATGGFLTSLVVAATALLWLGHSRAWFDGTPIPEPGRPAPREQRPGSPWDPPGSAPPRSDLPPPHTGTFGAAPPTDEPMLLPPPSAPLRRPDAVVWACILTWAFSGIAVALLGASLTVLLADPSLVWAELERQNPGLVAESGLTRDDLMRTTYATLGVAGVWALVAIVLAVLAWRRRSAGRIGLLVCAAAAALFCVLASFGSALLLVPAFACVATVVLLARADVRAWFAVRHPHP